MIRTSLNPMHPLWDKNMMSLRQNSDRRKRFKIGTSGLLCINYDIGNVSLRLCQGFRTKCNDFNLMCIGDHLI